MGNGVNISQGNLMSVTDMCGQKVLGMSGSLLNYINTGNAGTLPKADSFQKTVETPNKKQKKHINIQKILKFGAIAFSVIALGILLFSKLAKKGNVESAKEPIKIWDRIKEFFKPNKTNNSAPKVDTDELKDVADKLKATGDDIGKIINGQTSSALSSSKPKFIPCDDNQDVDEHLKTLVRERITKTNVSQDKLEDVVEVAKENAQERLGLPAPKVKIKTPRKKPTLQPQTPDIIILGESQAQSTTNNIAKVADEVKKNVSQTVVKQPQVETVPNTQVIDKVVVPDEIREKLAQEAQKKAEKIEPIEIDVDDINLRLQKRNNSLNTYDSQLIKRKLMHDDDGFDYVDGYAWSKGDKFRIYDPKLKKDIGCRYQINEDGSIKPLIPKTKPTKKSAKKSVEVSGYYVPYDEKETYAYLNNQIKNVEKTTGLDLSEIMYKFGDDVPDKNINVEDIIREFGDSD